MISKDTLIQNGFSEKHLDALQNHAQEIAQVKNINEPKYLIKLLKKKFPKLHATLTMRNQPAPLTLAIEADCPQSQKNLTKAISQITELLRCPVITSGTLMPDACPSGNASASIPVGGAIAVENAIIPAAHSSDICCSLHASFFQSDLPTSELMDHLSKSTRFGPGGRSLETQIHHPVLDEPVWNNPFLRRLETKASAHIADQGDGNHFAYLGEIHITQELLTILINNNQTELAQSLTPNTTYKALVTHHGSRGLGATVYTRGLEAAVKHTKKVATDIPPEAAWLPMDNKQGEDYWQALQYLSRWTKANHTTIHQNFLTSINTTLTASIGNEHNFVWKKGTTYLHGKGATPAWKDESNNPLLGLIPMNMSAPIFLTLGSNNTEHLSFSPHGAGRNLSRSALLKKYTRKKSPSNQIQTAIASSTHHIDARWHLGLPDITETPLAYKPPKTIRQQIKKYKLATIIAEITPLGSIMAGRSPKHEKPLTPKQVRQIQHRADRRKTRQINWQDEIE